MSSAAMALHAAGNSLVANVGTLPAYYWHTLAAALPPLAGSGLSVANRGVGGMSISVDAGAGTLMATGASNIDANLVAGKLNVLSVLELPNEMKANGNNAVNAHAAMRSYCLARRAAAVSAGRALRIIVATAPPAGADPLVNGSTMQGRIDARNLAMAEANRLIRQNYGDYSDVLLDLAAMRPFSTIYANGDFRQAVFAASGAYARGDGQPDDYTHMGNFGNGLFARGYAATVACVRL